MIKLIIITTILLLILIPLFGTFVQTIKNLLAFIALMFTISVMLILVLRIEFMPLFFLVTYLGAIIITLMFLVLTFDRREENGKGVFEPKGLFNMFMFFMISASFFTLASTYNKML
jgi:hypothetical protein